jgi:hypothetical protein
LKVAPFQVRPREVATHPAAPVALGGACRPGASAERVHHQVARAGQEADEEFGQRFGKPRRVMGTPAARQRRV